MDEQHSNFGYMCPECRRIFLRRDSKHKNCTIGELGGKNLKFVSRNNYQFGEEEKEQCNKFKKESRKLVITIENIKIFCLLLSVINLNIYVHVRRHVKIYFWKGNLNHSKIFSKLSLCRGPDRVLS
jgi:Na+/melibiose symporter-like transporter